MDQREHRSTHSSNGKCWYTESLWELARDLPVETREVQSFLELQQWCWEKTLTLMEFAEHVRRVETADPAYPAILSAEGHLMDGAHRLVRALVRGETHVLVRRFPVTPPPDFLETDS